MPTTPTFKPGDRVRVTNPRAYGAGEEGVVVPCALRSCSFVVVDLEGTDGVHYVPGQLELVIDDQARRDLIARAEAGVRDARRWGSKAAYVAVDDLEALLAEVTR